MMNRTIFLIDGFNLYHSMVDAQNDLNGKTTKWLNIHSLCESYIHLFGNQSKLVKVYYFTAFATHRIKQDPNVVKRHKLYIRCLKSTGIEVIMGRFKEVGGRHEEKETDVAIACKLLELFFLNECDTIVLMSGDTDMVPALKTSKRLFPRKKIYIIFPYKRKNIELANYADGNFKINCKTILKHQLSNPHLTRDGLRIYKPKSW